jgi:hypothetical protein
MMAKSVDDFFPSRYLKANDLEDGVEIITIDSVSKESMRNPQGGPDVEKPVVSFVGIEKGLILNRTNANTIAKLYGKDTDGWCGQYVTLYVTTVEVAGETYDVLRVRPQNPADEDFA